MVARLIGAVITTIMDHIFIIVTDHPITAAGTRGHPQMAVIEDPHTDKMKINVELQTCAAVQCLEDNCPWKRVCANHVTAGDFRTEGGSRPLLKLKQEEIFCESYGSVGNGYEPNEEPKLQGTRPWHLQVQGCCDYNCVLWSELVEEVDNYEI